MSIDATGRISGGGTPIKMKSREEEAGAVSPCRTRKMKFHEGLAAGWEPREALAKCEPSAEGDISKEHLVLCAAAGLKGEEIGKGYGIGKDRMFYLLHKYGVKLPQKPGGKFTAPLTGEQPPETPPATGGEPPGTPTPDPAPAAAAGDDQRFTLTEAGSAALASDTDEANAAALAEKIAEENREAAKLPDDLFGVPEYFPDLTKAMADVHSPRKVYVAHPLRGTAMEDNIARATEICREYAGRRDVIPFSPLHAFGFLDPMTYDPAHGMALCFALLEACDELWVHGNWWTSEGCLAEICFAVSRGIPVRFMTLHPIVERRRAG